MWTPLYEEFQNQNTLIIPKEIMFQDVTPWNIKVSCSTRKKYPTAELAVCEVMFKLTASSYGWLWELGANLISSADG